MTLEDLVADGWRRHADEPQTVSEALAQGAASKTPHEGPTGRRRSASPRCSWQAVKRLT